MNPYRTAATPAPEVQGKSRSKFKTLWYKLQIKIRGTWKQRYERCDRCLVCFRRVSGDYINPEPIFHAMKHQVLDRRSPIIPPDPIMIEE
jgi:hypothetical protein